MKKKNSNKKALFIQRFGAYIIDILLIAVIASIISIPFINENKNEKLQTEAMEIVEKMQNSEITVKEYVEEYSSIYYKLARFSGIVTLITLLLDVLYFVVYQVYAKGQTIGKKIMKIKVVSEDGKLTTDQMIIRSLLANSILATIITFSFMLFIPKSVYFYCVSVVELIQYLSIFISVIMIMKRKDGKSIHDMLAHTKVVRV